MREIKFRGKRSDNGEWVYGYYHYDPSIGIHYIRVDCMDYEVDPETVGQFTGMKDKNGKEIYEGDIVKRVDFVIEYSGYRPYIDSIREKIGIVEYCDCRLAYILVYEFDKYDYLSGGDEYEVIGNIYDNPELIGR